MDAKEQLLQKCKKHAEEKNINLNSNEKIVDTVLNGLLRNKEKQGEIYCPCRIVMNKPEEDKKIICPCQYHMDEIEKDGHCHCFLFVKKTG